MSVDNETSAFFERTIMVLDPALGGLAALEATATLAEATTGRLDVLFVEDEDLLRVADFPFAREISLSGSGTRSLDAAALARDFQRAVERARRAVASTTHARRLDWRFDIVRQRLERAVETVSAHGNLIALEGLRPIAVERIKAQMAGPVSSSFLLAGRQLATSPGPVVVCAPAASDTAPARHLARHIARRSGVECIDISDFDEFLASIGVLTGRPWRPGNFPGFRPRLAVIGRTAWPEPGLLKILSARANCPVIMVGGTRRDEP